MAEIRLVSAGSGKSIEVGDGITVKELREIANLSDDLKLNFNGSTVEDEAGTTLQGGDSIIASPEKVGHGA